jgi:hypothetical protein
MMTTTVVERTSFQEGRLTSFISFFTFRRKPTIWGNELASFSAAFPDTFSASCSDKRHASFRVCPSSFAAAMSKPSCAAAYRMSLEEWSRWGAGGRSGGSGFGPEARVFRLDPATDASRQDEEKKEYRQIQGNVVETIPGWGCEGNGEQQQKNNRGYDSEQQQGAA